MEVKIGVPDQRIKDMLCTAMDMECGGSWYWIEDVKSEFAPGLTVSDFRTGGQFQNPNNYHHPHELIPLADGCALVIGSEEGSKRLDRAAIERGLQLMATKAPKHFADLVEENDDATTGDVFLQYCLFGELIFG